MFSGSVCQVCHRDRFFLPQRTHPLEGTPRSKVSSVRDWLTGGDVCGQLCCKVQGGIQREGWEGQEAEREAGKGRQEGEELRIS